MDFLLDKLNRRGWVNIFPEGKVTVSDRIGQLRWGVGRLVWDCSHDTTLIPVLHCGMDSVLPNPATDHESQPCVIRPGNLVTINIGPPVNMASIVRELRQVTANHSTVSSPITNSPPIRSKYPQRRRGH